MSDFRAVAAVLIQLLFALWALGTYLYYRYKRYKYLQSNGDCCDMTSSPPEFHFNDIPLISRVKIISFGVILAFLSVFLLIFGVILYINRPAQTIPGAYLTLASNQEGTLLVGANSDVLAVWNLAESPNLKWEKSIQNGAGMKLIADDSQIIVWERTGFCRYNVSSGELIHKTPLIKENPADAIPDDWKAVFSPDGKNALIYPKYSICKEENPLPVFVWDTQTGAAICQLEKSSGLNTFAAALSADGARFAAAIFPQDNAESSGVCIWNTQTGKIEEFFSVEDSKDCFISASCLAFSPDGNTLAFSFSRIPRDMRGEAGAELIFIDIPSGKQRECQDTPPACLDNICFSSTGKYFLASYNSPHDRYDGRRLGVWRLPEEQSLVQLGVTSFKCFSDSQYVRNAIFIPHPHSEDLQIAVAMEKTVHVYRIQTIIQD